MLSLKTNLCKSRKKTSRSTATELKRSKKIKIDLFYFLGNGEIALIAENHKDASSNYLANNSLLNNNFIDTEKKKNVIKPFTVEKVNTILCDIFAIFNFSENHCFTMIISIVDIAVSGFAAANTKRNE